MAIMAVLPVYAIHKCLPSLGVAVLDVLGRLLATFQVHVLGVVEGNKALGNQNLGL